MAMVRAALRQAGWLTAGRARGWIRVLGLLGLAACAAMVLLTAGGTRPDPWGRPLGTDFSSFWVAARLALAGPGAGAWDTAAHAAAQLQRFPRQADYDGSYYAFFYPPPFLLLCLPLGLLPYAAALAAWLVATGAAYVAALRALLPRAWPATLAALAFPAVLLNAGHGQNGMLSAALLGGAASWLERRPRLAGACLGGLCFKPQLALLVVPALVCARRWRCLAWCAGTAGLLCAGATLAFGTAGWRGFLAAAPLAQAALDSGLVGFGKMVSPFAASRLLGLPAGAAWAVQAAASLASLAVVCRVAARRPGAGPEAATLAVAACLATPFLLDYDLMLLAVPLAWVAPRVAEGEALPWERLVLAAAYALPLLARPLAVQGGLPVAPLVTGALLWVAARRAAMPQAVQQGWRLPRPGAAAGARRAPGAARRFLAGAR